MDRLIGDTPQGRKRSKKGIFFENLILSIEMMTRIYSAIHAFMLE